MPKPCCASSLPRLYATNSLRMCPSVSFSASGADSTVVAGLATAESHDIHSYTVVFDDPALSAYDERAGARAVSRHLGTKHTELPVAHIDPFDLLDMLRSSISRSATRRR